MANLNTINDRFRAAYNGCYTNNDYLQCPRIITNIGKCTACNSLY